MKGLHGLIFAYEKHLGLRELTERRSPASVPFGGRYRIIDFLLSSMVNAGIDDVGIILQSNYQSLLDHVGSGKDWDLSRKHGGLRLLPPFHMDQCRGDMGYRGRMEALASVASYLEKIRQDHVVLANGDTVINIPLQKVYEEHLRSGADITCVCTTKRDNCPDDATYLMVGEDSAVTSVEFNVKQPAGLRALDIYILSKELLLQLVNDCKRTADYSFRTAVLQRMTAQLKLRAYVWDGYSAKIHTLQEYYDRSMEMMDPAIRRDLFPRERPVYTKEMNVSSTYVDPDGGCVNSVVADGCTIEGTVENSVLFRGVSVAKGAKVSNCILMQNVSVGPEAEISCVIADKNVKITEGCTLVASGRYPMALAKDSEV